MDELTHDEWLQHKIYSPIERVRARQLENGEWQVFDGVEVHMFDDEVFKGTYALCAQSMSAHKERGQYEYH
jgi:hypothetical protein